MNPLLTKIAIVSSGVAGVTVIGAGTAYLTFPSKPAIKEDISSKQSEVNVLPETQTVTRDKSISDLLNKKRLLTKDNSDEGKWTTIWQTFSREHTSKKPESPWSFENWTLNGENTTNLDSFKTQCVNLGQQKVSGTSDPIFIAVDKYCTASTENA